MTKQYGWFLGQLASCPKEHDQEGLILMMTIMMLSVTVRVVLFILYCFFLLPMMIRIVRVWPEGGILQPFCLLRVWDG
jgi:hypothetical protein